MIASENFVPRAVLECQGSVLTNKYAEGYPGRRYYGGCEWVDVSEQLAIDRAKALFGAEHANVQPHSGAQANAAVYHALLTPGDTIMGLSLAHGGHLTHGMKINVSGRLYDIAAYEVDRESSLIDMDEVARIARERRPKLMLAGWSAYPRQLDFARFREIADEVGALLMVDMAHFAGLVAAGLHPNPVDFGADVVTTTTHKTLGGPRAGIILCKEEHAKKIDSAVFPGQQGGPLEHVIAAKAVALKIAASELFRERQQRTVEGARALASELLGRPGHGVERAHRRHRRAPDARGPARAEPELTRQAGRGPAARDRDHRQPQRGPIRPAPADGGLGPAHRHARAGDARLQPRTSPRSGKILATALRPEFEARAVELAERVGAIVERYPLYEGLDAPRCRLRRAAPARRRAAWRSSPERAMLCRVDGATDRARRAVRVPRGRGGDRAADAADDAARRAVGAIDEPRERGLSDRATPLLGGLAIFAGVLVAGADLAAERATTEQLSVARACCSRPR